MSTLVFMSYSRTDTDRVEPIVNYLVEKGVSVWWDKNIEPGVRFRDVITEVLENAKCIVVFWSQQSVKKDFVRAEAEAARSRGVIFPIALDKNLKIPPPFGEYQCLDFSGLDFSNWNNKKNDPVLKNLASKIKAFEKRETVSRNYVGFLESDNWTVKRSKEATEEVSNFISEIGSFKEILISEGKPVEDIRGPLIEVDKTYKAVAKAIERFIAPVFGKDKVDPGPYINMERGTLITDIQNGRGHCHKILIHYGKVRGLRDWLEPKLTVKELKKLDQVFEKLGTADNDLFEAMTEIGEILTNESKLIVNLLITDQDDLAKRRIITGRETLNSLEISLNRAIKELNNLTLSLGFAT